MSDDEATQNALLELDKESDAVDQQVAAYQRKLMIPIWNKRREVLKKIPSFWGRVVSIC
jgi:template-activating factor I